MYKLYNIYDGNVLVDCNLAHTIDSGSDQTILRGVPGKVTLNYELQYPPEFTIEEDLNARRFMVYCFQTAYIKSDYEDPHQIFATLLGISKGEAKKKCYEIIYRGATPQ